MLFPPPGVKIRRTLETFFLTDQPTMIAEHDLQRVVLTVSGDAFAAFYVALAGSQKGLDTAVSAYFGNYNQFFFYGPEEVWARCISPVSPPGGNLLIQSVFYD